VVLASSALYATRNRQGFQPTLFYLREGEPRGYQALTWTDATSLHPAVAGDAEGRLYVAWADALGESFHYPIYLATTRITLRESWQSLTPTDYGVILGDFVNRVASGIILVPLTSMWLLLPLPWLLIVLAYGHPQGRGARRALLVALFIYLGAKYLLTSQVLTYLPGLAYLPPAESWLWIHLTPLLTLLVSVTLGRLLARRMGDGEFSVMRAYLLVSLIDWVLSNVIYAIGYFE
jgi:hypothetical protein